MAYNILGINPGHNGSAAVISDGKLVYYLEEERLTKEKRDGNPFKTIIDICSKFSINELIIGGTNTPAERSTLSYTKENPYFSLVRKLNLGIEDYTNLSSSHHLLHAFSSLHNSPFQSAAVIVVDGCGSWLHYNDIAPFSSLAIEEGKNNNVHEAESIYEINTNKFPIEEGIEKHYVNYISNNINVETKFINRNPGIVKVYEGITDYLGFHPLDAGKVMGLSSYGKSNPNIPPLFVNHKGNLDIFKPSYPAKCELLTNNTSVLHGNQKTKDFHHDKSKLNMVYADLAYEVQTQTEKEIHHLIEKAINLTGNNNICITGGYGLNCVANYNMKKKFPKINFFHDPVSFDGGISIGAAYLGWLIKKEKNDKSKSFSLYLGPKYSLKKYKKQIKNYSKMFNTYKVNYKDVAKIISERNIVTIFQGRSEAGPRALGNRSILYDPTDPNGKDFVNKVKKREWFRPFAGTVLLEKANEYFDMAGLKESPFMMYAMDVWPDKQDKIPCITHVDGTCRIQTLTEEQNPHYYKLIQEFEKITGVPILFNTSFNLAGDPLVETIEDALETMLKSEMKYMYVPELEMLLEKK